MLLGEKPIDRWLLYLFSIYLNRYTYFFRSCLPEYPHLPPLSTRIILRQFNGRALLCSVDKIDSLSLKLSKVYLLEVVGSRGASFPIYDIKRKLGTLEIPIDSIVHWEIAPSELGLAD